MSAESPDASPRRPLKAYLLLGLAVITCPCHLLLLLAILAGTALAGALTEHVGLLFVALSAIFIPSLWLGLKALKSNTQRRT